MKTNEEYLQDYYNRINEFSKKGESWRLTITPEEFLKGIEEIRSRCINARKRNEFPESWIKNSEGAGVVLLLQGKITLEEARAQSAKSRKEREKNFAKEAPAIQEELKTIQTPLNFLDVVHILRWFGRKQITLEMLPKEVFDEFIKTAQYEIFIKGKKNGK